MTTTQTTYVCPYCRITSDGAAATCPHCGAPIDVRRQVSDSGWVQQPPVRDMARIRFSRSTCQISGTYVPVADMGLEGDDWVYFSHHVLLHTAPSVRLEAMKMAGGWSRMRGGMPLVMMMAHGPGHIAFSHDDPGETLAIPLQAGQSVDVVEHRFLVATGNVEYRWQPSNVWFRTRQQRGNDTEYETHYPLGMTLDSFTAEGAPGLLLLHSPGNVLVRDLAPNQVILVQPGGLVYKDPSVGVYLHFEYPHGQYWFSSARWDAKTAWLALRGPGRVAVQSVFEPPEQVGPVWDSSGASEQRW